MVKKIKQVPVWHYLLVLLAWWIFEIIIGITFYLLNAKEKFGSAYKMISIIVLLISIILLIALIIWVTERKTKTSKS